jgi:hypothetical protein
MSLYKGRKPKRLKSKFCRGDVVRFASRLRPDLLPASISRYGLVVSTGPLCSVRVWFFDLPEDEIVLLSQGEVEAAPGISAPAHYTRIDKSKWTEWNDEIAEVRALDCESDLPDFETLDEAHADIKQRKTQQRQHKETERTRVNNSRNSRTSRLDGENLKRRTRIRRA